MLQAIGKHVIVKAVYKEEKTLILTSKEPVPTHYEVVSVGDDIENISLTDKLPFPQYTNQIIEHDGQKYFVINYENITAIIN